ncbi:MAG TPA: hypothetical protein VGG09_14055 [Acidimicrobiales bacterium]
MAPPAHAQTTGRGLLFAPSFSSNVVSVFDLNTDRLVASIGIQAKGACCAYGTPDGKYVYVVDGLSPHVTRINVASLKVDHLTTLAGTWGDRGAPVPDDDQTFWLDEIPQGDVQGIDVATGQVVHTFPFIGNTFSVSHDGRFLYEVNTSKQLDGTAIEPGAIVVRSALTGAVVGSVSLPPALGQVPIGAYVSPDDQKLYVDTDNPLGPSLLYVIDITNPSRPELLKTLTLGDTSLIATFTPDGRQLWVPNAGSGTVSVIDTATDTVVHVIKTGIFVANVVFQDGRAYLSESPSPVPPNSLTSLVLTLAGVIPGAALTPGSGATSFRPGIDLLRGEIVQYDTATYQPLNTPPLQLPSVSFVMQPVQTAP